MKKINIALFILGLGMSTSAMAIKCQYYPDNQRLSLNTMINQVQKQGNEVLKAKIDDNCYEIKIKKNNSNIYYENKYDMKTGKLVQQKEKYKNNQQH